jgi:hypothetical protein
MDVSINMCISTTYVCQAILHGLAQIMPLVHEACVLKNGELPCYLELDQGSHQFVMK